MKCREDIKHTKELEKKLKSTVAKEEAKAKKAESDAAEYEALLETSEKQEEWILSWRHWSAWTSVEW